MEWQNIALALGYGLFYIDLIFQIRRLLHTQSSRDVSARGVAVRLTASALFQLKYFSVGDIPLVAGGLVYTSLVAVYAFLVFRYRTDRSK